MTRRSQRWSFNKVLNCLNTHTVIAMAFLTIKQVCQRLAAAKGREKPLAGTTVLNYIHSKELKATQLESLQWIVAEADLLVFMATIFPTKLGRGGRPCKKVVAVKRKPHGNTGKKYKPRQPKGE